MIFARRARQCYRRRGISEGVQNHLGHSSLATTMEIYTRARPGRSADLAAKMDALMAEI